MIIIDKLKRIKADVFIKQEEKKKINLYLHRFQHYSFNSEYCIDERQYEAAITRMYHTIEKGLSYENYRPGFGRDNINFLIRLLNHYADDGYSVEASFYATALCTLEQYITKNNEHGKFDRELEAEIKKLPGSANGNGGIIEFTPESELDVKNLSYKNIVSQRHSMRHFSEKPLSVQSIKNALEIAQNTPSACNRQGWRTIIITDKSIIGKVLKYQNGNRGFGQEIDKLLVVLGDLRCSNRERELYQVFIDGGMFANSLLYALHYEHIASVPLSGSLSTDQEYHVRALLKLNEYDEIIMFIGLGNYPTHCQTTKSTRRQIDVQIL